MLTRVLQLAGIVAGFVLVSWLAHRYEAAIAHAIGAQGALGPLLFVLLTAVFVVFIIPLDIPFLIPVGAALWGAVPTALFSIAGWTLGAAAAFALSRRYGRPLVVRFVGTRRVEEAERRVPVGDLFWSVVLLRMLVPVDILSYALGLASTMYWRRYLLATALGVSPFGFFFSYAGTLPLWWQAGAVLAAFLLVGAIFTTYGRSRIRRAQPPGP